MPRGFLYLRGDQGGLFSLKPSYISLERLTFKHSYIMLASFGDGQQLVFPSGGGLEEQALTSPLIPAKAGYLL